MIVKNVSSGIITISDVRTQANSYQLGITIQPDMTAAIDNAEAGRSEDLQIQIDAGNIVITDVTDDGNTANIEDYQITRVVNYITSLADTQFVLPRTGGAAHGTPVVVSLELQDVNDVKDTINDSATVDVTITLGAGMIGQVGTICWRNGDYSSQPDYTIPVVDSDTPITVKMYAGQAQLKVNGNHAGTITISLNNPTPAGLTVTSTCVVTLT